MSFAADRPPTDENTTEMTATNQPPELPGAPQAWLRCLRFAGQALLDLVGLIWLSVVVSLAPGLLGVALAPSALRLLRSNAERSRRLAEREVGVTVVAHYREIDGDAGPLQSLHTWQRLQDPVVRRDLVWCLLNPIVGLLLGLISLGLTLNAVWEVIAIPLQLSIDGFEPGTWFTLSALLDLPAWWGAATSALIAILEFVIGILLARPTLRALGRWTHWVLDVEDSAQWRQRAETLAATRSDALDMEQAELQRIERDLHDGAQMRFVATGLTISEAARLVREDPDRAIELLNQAKGESAAGLAELRSLVRGIRPPVLADRGLVDAVRALAGDIAVPTVVTSTLPERLAAPLESALYFAIAETLTNAVKHSGAGAIQVELAHVGDQVVARVSDDGVGGAEIVEDGGLAGIRRRLRTFDATIEVDSPHGGPTRVTLTTPYVSG